VGDLSPALWGVYTFCAFRVYVFDVHFRLQVFVYEGQKMVYPDEWRPRPFEREHSHCGGRLETLYVRRTGVQPASWQRVGWRCRGCGTAWMEAPS